MSPQPPVNPSIDKNRLFSIFAIISLIEGILAIVWIVSIPADPKNAILFGFSLKRIVLLGIILAGLIVILALWTSFIRRRRIYEAIIRVMDNQRINNIIGILGVLLLLIILIPYSEWGKWEATVARFKPLLIWLSLLLVQWFMLCRIVGGQFIREIKARVQQKTGKSRFSLLIIFGTLIAIYLLSTLLYPANINEDYWFETGVPILLWQIIVCVVIGILVNRYEAQIQRVLGKRTNLVIFLIIFITCAVLWSSTSLQPGSYEKAPLPPNNVIYPDKDAADYDLQAQSALLGLGFDNSSPLDRPFYPLFLAVIHLLSGQAFVNVMWLQAFLFGLFPAMVYLICAEFISRGWGMAASLAIELWGWNSIVANSVINTANPKQMMTDFFLAVIFSLVLYVTVLWLKGGPHELRYGFITGSLLGLAAYIRYSALILLPIWIILAIIKNKKQIRKGLITGSTILLAFLIFIMPWYARNIVMGKGFTVPFSGKVLFVIDQRYGVHDDNPKDVSPNGLTEQDNINRDINNPAKDQLTGKNNLSKPFLSWFTAHLTHNLMGSLLILPTSLEIATFNTSLDISKQIWTLEWDGKLPAGRLIVLGFQFFVLSIGAKSLFKKNKYITLAILFMFVGISITNSLGRTSGGRYIVPVDWMVIPVYLAGFLYVIGELNFANKIPGDSNIIKPIRRGLWVKTVLLVLLISAAPAIFEGVLAAFRPNKTGDQPLDQVLHDPGLSLSIEKITQIENDLESGNARAANGFVFFPTQQRIDHLPKIPSALLDVSEVNVMTFFVMLDKHYETVYFPYDQEIVLNNLDKVYLVGCKASENFIASNLIISRDDIMSDYSTEDALRACNR